MKNTEVGEFETIVKTNIGHGYMPGRLDTVIIDKGEKYSRLLIICKVDNVVAAFDVPDLIKFGKLFALNYQTMSSPDDAYTKMMKWIGKMCKKSPSSRYFKHIDPYGYQRRIDKKLWNDDMVEEILNRVNEYL